MLEKYHQGQEPKKVIQEVFEIVKEELSPADFAMTPSKRLRYDSMVRTLAGTLKKEEILSKNPQYKGKVWILSKFATSETTKI